MQFSLLGEGDDLAGEALRATQLLSANPDGWRVDPSWRALTRDFFDGTAGRALCLRLQQRLDAGAVVFPPEPLRALELTSLDDVRVVILGQDPYHARGQAEGLAFSVRPGTVVPPSLRNIFKELAREGPAVEGYFPASPGSLIPWAQNGVLLLNTSLTVDEAAPASHSAWGWENLTDQVIQAVSEKRQGVVFMLWGTHAQGKRHLIDATRHLILCANHPSPLSANRPPSPFLGCGHFGAAVQWLDRQ
jgi:uracil-DNA glycosylase